MNSLKNNIVEMKAFLLLWLSQSLSGLGSAMTGYALVIWSYTQEGSALLTALLMICSYAPYVVFSIFAGALSDRWNKKITMLACDSLAAAATVVLIILLKNDMLCIWHLYIINAINGLMNTVQQPASEVAVTRVLPKKYYQKVGGLRYLANSLNSILTPVIATAVLSFAGIEAVIAIDLISFAAAFFILAFFVKIPDKSSETKSCEKLIISAKKGISYLKKEKGVFMLILFLAAINLVASIYQAAFPAMILSKSSGGEKVLGTVNAAIGTATLLGSILTIFLKTPKNRVKVVANCLLFSMSFENFLLALGNTPVIWCIGGFLGWLAIPVMNTNLDAVMRIYIPENIQGRIYSVRNSLQFFTIPIGYFIGGVFVDYVFEPFMAIQNHSSILVRVFGSEKGSGAAFLFFLLAFLGIGVCIYFRHNKYIRELNK